MRRWTAGWAHTEAGVNFRVVPGRKSPDDLRMEWQTDDGWQPVTMAAAAIMADFFFDNEDVLYPPSRGFKGGRKFMEFLRLAVKEGWQTAVHGLQRERAAKEEATQVTFWEDTAA